MVLDLTNPLERRRTMRSSSGAGDFKKTLDLDPEQAAAQQLPYPWSLNSTPQGGVSFTNSRTGHTQTHAPQGVYHLKKIEGTVDSSVLALKRTKEDPRTQAPAGKGAKGSGVVGLGAEGNPSTLNPSGPIPSAPRSLVGYALESFISMKQAIKGRSLVEKMLENKKAEARKKRQRAKERDKKKLQEQAKATPWAAVWVEIVEVLGLQVHHLKSLVAQTYLKEREDSYDDVYHLKLDHKAKLWNQSATFTVYEPKATVLIKLEGLQKKQKNGDMLGQCEVPVRDDLDTWVALKDETGNESGSLHIRLERNFDFAKPQKQFDLALPAGWESKLTDQGRLVYVDNTHRTTQWAHPNASADTGAQWIKTQDEKGRTCWMDTVNTIRANGQEEHVIRYTNPGEPSIVQDARHNMVSVLHGFNDLVAEEVDTVEMDRDNMIARQEWDWEIERDEDLLQSIDYTTFRGRLYSFSRPTKLTRWPHGKHKLFDRPDVYQRLKEIEHQRGIKEAHSVVDREGRIHGEIPLLEHRMYKRKQLPHDSHTVSLAWDELHVEIAIPDHGDSKLELVWGQLEPKLLRTHHSPFMDIGRITEKHVTKARSWGMERADLAAVRIQYPTREITELHRFDIFTTDNEVHTFACTSSAMVQQVVKLLNDHGEHIEPKRAQLSPFRMAEAGFFFSPSADVKDRVHCGFCGVQIGNWGHEDDPFEMHYFSSPECDYITQVHKDTDIEEKSKLRFSTLHHPVTSPSLGGAGHGSNLHRTTTAQLNSELEETWGGTFKLTMFTDMNSTALGSEFVNGLAKDATKGNGLREHRRRMMRAATGYDGKRLLEAAAANNMKELKELLEMGVPVNCTDAGYRTPLHWAAAYGHIQAATELLACGADVNARSAHNLSPYDLAMAGNFELVAGLIKVAGYEDHEGGRHGGHAQHHVNTSRLH